MKSTIDDMIYVPTTQPNLRLEEGSDSFKTRSITLVGDLSIKVPGRETYADVTKIVASYKSLMDVSIEGNIATIPEQAYALEHSRVEIVAYRENEAETAIAHTEESSKVGFLLPDPEFTIYQGNKETVLNQVIGVPVIAVKRGRLTYSKD